MANVIVQRPLDFIHELRGVHYHVAPSTVFFHNHCLCVVSTRVYTKATLIQMIQQDGDKIFVWDCKVFNADLLTPIAKEDRYYVSSYFVNQEYKSTIRLIMK